MLKGEINEVFWDDKTSKERDLGTCEVREMGMERFLRRQKHSLHLLLVYVFVCLIPAPWQLNIGPRLVISFKVYYLTLLPILLFLCSSINNDKH